MCENFGPGSFLSLLVGLVLPATIHATTALDHWHVVVARTSAPLFLICVKDVAMNIYDMSLKALRLFLSIVSGYSSGVEPLYGVLFGGWRVASGEWRAFVCGFRLYCFDS